MSIIKIKKRENPYVQIDTRIYNDPNLSWKAKGVLSYLLSKPTDWTIRVTDIINKSTDGRDSVYSALRELRKHGYLLKAPIRNDKGIITEWIEELYEEPSEEVKEFFEKQQVSRKNRRKKTEEETSVGEEFVDKTVDNIQPKPITENTEVANTTQNPFTGFPNMVKPNMADPNMENPEILIIKNTSNIEYTNIDNNKKEDTVLPINSNPSIIENFYNLIQKDLSEVSFNTWIKPIIIHIDKKEVELEVANNFSYKIVKDRYLDIIEKNFKELGIKKITLKEKTLV